jgi:hypothetical protein
MRTGVNETGGALKVDLPTAEAISAQNFGLGDGPWGTAAKTMGAVIRSPTRALGTEDVFFKMVAFRAEIHQAAMDTALGEGLTGRALGRRVASIVNNPPEDILLRGQNEAALQTFTSEPGAIGQKVLQFANAHPMMRAVIPFVRTPVNVFRYGLERSGPLAFASKQFRQDLTAGGIRAARAKARLSMGSAFMGYVGSLAMEGTVTGSGPADKRLRQVWLQDHQPYSVKVGGTWVGYNRLDPAGWLMVFSADLAELSGHLQGHEAEEAALAGIMAVQGRIIDKSFMGDVAGLTEVINAPNAAKLKALQRGTAGFASSLFVPQAVSQVARAVEPERGGVGGQDAAELFLNTLKDRVPGYRDDLPLDSDLFGQPILLSNGWNSDNVNGLAAIGARVFSPAKFKEDSLHPIARELLDNKIGIGSVSPYVQGVNLREFQGGGLYWQYKRDAGMLLEDQLGKIVGSVKWDKMEAFEREVTVAQVVSKVRGAAARKIIAENTALQDQIVLIRQGLDE